MSDDRHGYSAGHLALAFLGGAAAGAITALLLAPRSGAETREQIAQRASTARDDLAHVPERVKVAYDQAVGAAREAYQEARAEDPE